MISMASMNAATLVLMGLALLSGCQQRPEGPQRVQISGTVTWNGKPIESGMVHLVPVNGAHPGMTGSEIRNGSYRVSNKGGALPGEYRVEVTATRSIPPVLLADGSELAVEQYLPKKFNEKSEMQLTVPEQSKSLNYDIDLKD